MTWPQAVHAAMKQTATTGEKWTVEPTAGGWQVIGHGPYTGAPAGQPAAAIYFEQKDC